MTMKFPEREVLQIPHKLKLDMEGGESAQTVIYIHGIGPKPEPDVLRCRWDNALFGRRMGDRTRLAYWMIEERHGPPRPGHCEDKAEIADVEASALFQEFTHPGETESMEALIERLGQNKSEREFLHQLHSSLEAEEKQEFAQFEAEFIGPLTRLLTRMFIKDSYDFFYVRKRQQRMKQSLIDALASGGGPFVIVAHSQGSMIAYDVLRELDPEQVSVPLFLTIGSPLGLSPVMKIFRKWTGVGRGDRLPFPPCVDQWLNLSAKGDPVAFDKDLGDEIEHDDALTDRLLRPQDEPANWNADLSKHAHSATGYLKTVFARTGVLKYVDSDFDQPVGRQTISADLVEAFEQRSHLPRRPVLIELKVHGPYEGSNNGPHSLRSLRQQLVHRIESFSPNNPTVLKIDPLERFVAANLTRFEVERLRTEHKALDIRWIWKDAEKAALIDVSAARVQALPAHRSYNARGQGITWAVLDTGIQSDHSHFEQHDNIAATYDCTKTGQRPSERRTEEDPNGHGTHVAGIIAGSGKQGNSHLIGMAPEAQVVSFKVLDDAGRGRDSYVIKALDEIARVNDAAGELVIHGVNLSLGGPFDATVYGCGHTPVCKELRRLWRQGVVVVIAAGNEGQLPLQVRDHGTRQTNLDMSINDPANLEEAIAVGSVHRTQPHTYGVSFFSSRGPTADGRLKPDLVAPGEKVLSANSRQPNGGYVARSGTSMAAPHVSGIIAAFLSVRRDFIGYPDRVKALLLDSCIDLKRDPYVQGRGLVNLMEMLSDT